MTQTASMKRKRKAGRPRNEEASRTESGRISRAKEPADKLALNVRARMAGISLVEAKDQKAESFIGILSIRGLGNGGISMAQYDALVEYRQLCQDHARACDTPGSHVAGEGTGGVFDLERHVRWCSSVKQRYDLMKRALYHAQEIHSRENLWGALDVCVRQDLRMWHLVGALRLAANAVAKCLRGM